MIKGGNLVLSQGHIIAGDLGGAHVKMSFTDEPGIDPKGRYRRRNLCILLIISLES